MPDQLVTYRFYPGGNTTDDYTVDRNCAYGIHAVIEGLNSFDKRVTKKTFEYTEPANCFVIAPEAGNELSFNPYLAPGADVAGTGVVYEDRVIDGRFSRVAGVKIVWQTAAGLIRSVSLAQGMVNIATNTDGVAGNALVAIYDDRGTPIWSWHIWVTPYEKVLYRNGTNGRLQNYAGHTWMDRNLGALSTIKNDNDARGVYYQWGRKDPFVTSVADGGTAPIRRDMGTALNIDQSVENPTVFFTNQADNTWNGGGPLPALWQATGGKTLFDPCPSGWRLPEKTAWDTFKWSISFNWDSSTGSGAARDIEGETLPAWYPLSGRLDNSSMGYGASPAYLWSASFGTTMPYVFQFSASGASTAETSGAWGAAVRCVKQ